MHVRSYEFHEAVRSQRTGLKSCHESLVSDFIQPAKRYLLSIIYQDIDAAQSLHRASDCRDQIDRFSHIARHRQCEDTALARLLRSPLDLFQSSTGEHEINAGRCYGQGYALANTLARPCH